MAPLTDAEIAQRAIDELEPLKSPRHWLTTTRLSDRLGVTPKDLERSLIAHAESADWIVRYSYYPSGRSLELLWGHKSNVGKQQHLPAVHRMDARQPGDVGPDNVDSWIFISHNSRDEAKVRDVAHVVQCCGFGPWIFQQQIEREAPVADSVRTAIKQCRHFIVYISRNSLPSLWVEKELRVHLAFAEQAPEKETIVVADGSDPELRDVVQSVIEGKPSPIEMIIGLPGEKRQERAHRMLTSLEESQDRLHFLSFSDDDSELRKVLGTLSKEPLAANH